VPTCDRGRLERHITVRTHARAFCRTPSTTSCLRYCAQPLAISEQRLIARKRSQLASISMRSVSNKTSAPPKRAATPSAPSPASASDSKRSRASEDLAPLQLDGLLPDLSSYVQLWLSQDIPSFDVQGCVAGPKRVTAHLLQKSPCILAGRPFFDAVFAQLGCSVDWHAAEGSTHCSDGHRHVATVSGPAHAVLKGERTALELVVRCSGVATLASRYAQAAAAAGWKGRVAGTRKVAPGLRLVDKCAAAAAPAAASGAAAAVPCDG
jgi:hypothetical protein